MRTVFYCTAQELLAKIPARDRDAATDDDGDGVPDDDLLQSVIGQACDEVDTYYAIRGVAGPLDVAVYPLAKQAALHIALETLYTRRGEPAERNPHHQTTAAMRALLVKVAEGRITVGGPAQGSGGPSATAVPGDVISIESEPSMTAGRPGKLYT